MTQTIAVGDRVLFTNPETVHLSLAEGGPWMWVAVPDRAAQQGT